MTPEALVKHYQSLLVEHGSSSKTLQWTDRESQYARFSVLSGLFAEPDSVLDVGCGLADFYRFMRGRGMTGAYHGVDVVPEFVDLANKALSADPQAKASLADATGPLPSGFDYAVLSGVFNIRMEDNSGFMKTMLRRMWDAAGKGIAFNAMSTEVDYYDDGLWYVDPCEVFKFCKRELGGNVVLRHDYALRDGGYPFEFAVYVYKEPQFTP